MVERLLMMKVDEALDVCRGWNEPRRVPGNPFRLVCSVASPATLDEVSDAWPGASLNEDLLELWSASREATLFVDADYGQWGLRLLSPSASATLTREKQVERLQDFRPHDVVIGRFLGDQDLLVVEVDGSVLVSLPLYPRAEWFAPARSLRAFISEYVAKAGDKYWE